jgi:cytochrome c-type biogenesis protein CcmE
MNVRGWPRRTGLVVGLVVVLGGFGYLVYGGIGDNLVYYVTPSELMERGHAAYDRPVRLAGRVVTGSVRWDADALDLRFRIRDEELEMEVHSKGAPPQMFRDEIDVVVEGRYSRAGVFESTSLMVMHSNEYRAPEEGERPADLYRGLVREGEG